MIPLKIETLLAGKTVEQNRVEYKEGWNPEEVIHTICAFANDYCNVNGGYIVLGVETKGGIPVHIRHLRMYTRARKYRNRRIGETLAIGLWL